MISWFRDCSWASLTLCYPGITNCLSSKIHKKCSHMHFYFLHFSWCIFIFSKIFVSTGTCWNGVSGSALTSIAPHQPQHNMSSKRLVGLISKIVRKSRPYYILYCQLSILYVIVIYGKLHTADPTFLNRLIIHYPSIDNGWMYLAQYCSVIFDGNAHS